MARRIGVCRRLPAGPGVLHRGRDEGVLEVSLETAIESIKATLEHADLAIDQARQAIDASLARGVNGPAHLADLIRKRNAASADRDLIDSLLYEKNIAKYRRDESARILMERDAELESRK